MPTTKVKGSAAHGVGPREAGLAAEAPEEDVGQGVGRRESAVVHHPVERVTTGGSSTVHPSFRALVRPAKRGFSSGGSPHPLSSLPQRRDVCSRTPA